jgi:hypothetical protein
MRTIRRLYVYLVSFISLEVVVWGLIGLVRSVIGGEKIGSGVSQLASALSLIAVGVPVFLLHWWLAQRTIGNDEERFSRLRAVFLYAVLLATLIPMAQNVLALINRSWLGIFNLSERMAFIGQGQSWIDNLIGLLVNGIIAAYFFNVVRKDWAATPSGDAFVETRRTFRYIWVIYGLAMVVGGVQQVLHYILNLGETVGGGPGANLANGLALLVIGTPLWIYAWRYIQQTLIEQAEARSTLRLVVLYVLSLIGVGGVLVPAGLFLDVVLQALLGEATTLSKFLTEISDSLSVAIPFGGVWAYYGRTLSMEVAELPDTPRRSGLRRLYYYILAFTGLVTSFLGLNTLVSFIIDSLLDVTAWGDTLRNRLSGAISTLVVGIPLWIFTWRPMITEASQWGESGDHARRSLVRKVYLYLALFTGVLGVMGSAGSLIFQLLSKLLGDPPDNFDRASLILSGLLVLFIALLIYHWVVLRADSRLAERSLAACHEAYPVLVLVPEIGDFSGEMISILQRELPSLPVVVFTIDNGVPDETLSEAKAVIMPGDVAANPPEAIRLWLQGFDGVRLVAPTYSEGWLWTFGSGRSLSKLVQQTAKMVRYLAEGEAIPEIRETSPWMVVLYVFAGLVGIPLIISLFGLLSDILF